MGNHRQRTNRRHHGRPAAATAQGDHAEFVRRFGPNADKVGEVWVAMQKAGASEREIKLLRSEFEAATNTLRTGAPEASRAAVAAIQTHGVLSVMGRAVMSSVAEPAAIGARAGSPVRGLKAMIDTWGGIISRIAKNGPDGAGSAARQEARFVAEMLGVIEERGARTAVMRAATVDTVFVDMPAGANLNMLGVPGLAYLLGLALLVGVLRHKDFWCVDSLVAGFGVGGTVMAMWWVSGHLGFVPEHPETLDAVYVATSSGRMEALSFVAPVAATLDWLMFYSDASKVLTTGVAAVAGVVVGSAASALQNKTFRWEGFANPRDLGQHLLGSVLMGVGGVTALGCTIGQGLSGLSTLSLNSAVALAAIVLGAVVSLRQQAARLERTACV